MQLLPFIAEKQPTSDSEKAVTTCATCGSYTRNPLVVHGLIPHALSSILMPPPVKPQPQKKNRRVVAEARLISVAEMLQQLKVKFDNGSHQCNYFQNEMTIILTKQNYYFS